MTILDRLKRAVELQSANQPKSAEEIYLQVLEEEPGNADAQHLLGLIRADEDRYEESIALITEAIRIKPNASAFHHIC
jgi:tetratricopeptide (TPR) repeat protein